MDIPPVIRVTLNAIEKPALPGALASFARVVETHQRRREGVSYCEISGHTTAPAVNVGCRSLERLLTLGVDDTVAFIKDLAESSNEGNDDRRCLEENVATLSAWPPSFSIAKLPTRVIRVLENRIGSILDLLSLQDTAKLIYAITHLDSRLRVVVKDVVEHFVQLLNQVTVTSNQVPDFVIASALALTSVELLGRVPPKKQPQQDRDDVSKTDGMEPMPGSCEESLYGADGISHAECIGGLTNLMACERPLTTLREPLNMLERDKYEAVMVEKIGESVEASDCVDPGLLLLLTQVMANISLPAAVTSERIIRRVDVERLNEEQVYQFIHACAMAMNLHQIRVEDVIDKCMAKIGEYATGDTVALHRSGVAQAFHALYLTGKMDAELIATLANNMASNRVTFTNTVDFYRTAIPLAITGQLSSEPVCLWILNLLASNVDKFSEEVAHFLFLLTSIANNVKVVWKKREKVPLRVVALETDIYEKAETFLRQQEGEKAYFSSPRAAMLFLIERANALIKISSGDEFVQILLLNCAKNFKPDSRIKFELLNECKRRVKEIPCGGIPQVLQTLFMLFSPNSPELVETFALYLDRINTEIALYNSTDVVQIESPKLFALTFLEDVNLLGNILSTLDRCNLNRADLATNVIEMFERYNYKQLEKASFQALIDVLHYLSFSLDRHDAIDVLAILIQQRLEQGVEVSAGHLAAVSECFIAAPLTLNPLRHQALIQVIRRRANDAKGNKKALEDILNKLS